MIELDDAGWIPYLYLKDGEAEALIGEALQMSIETPFVDCLDEDEPVRLHDQSGKRN